MRPALKPGLRRVWRDEQTLQIGVDPDCATILTGIDRALAEIIESLAGNRTTEAVVTYARTHGVPAARTRRMLTMLVDCGVLEDGAETAGALRGLRPVERERLRPDLAAASISASSTGAEFVGVGSIGPGRTGGGGASLLRRRRACVAVHGAGRVGSGVATLLAAAGIGTVTVFDRRLVEPADLAPGGHGPDHLGMSRAAATMQRLRTDVPGQRRGRTDDWLEIARGSKRPDLVVLAPDEEVDRGLSAALVRDGVAHLVARVREVRGVVGPLVIPGTTACLRCQELHRLGRDPGWRAVVDAVETDPMPVRAVDVVLASTVAGVAALHVLAFLDDRPPPSLDGTIELTLPFGHARRRSWTAHPGCGCQWSHLAGSEPTLDDPEEPRSEVPPEPFDFA